MVITTIVLNDKISDENVKKLGEEYANKLKKTNKDMMINIHAVKNGKNVSSITLEK
jgi:hypothetical protein